MENGGDEENFTAEMLPTQLAGWFRRQYTSASISKLDPVVWTNTASPRVSTCTIQLWLYPIRATSNYGYTNYGLASNCGHIRFWFSTILSLLPLSLASPSPSTLSFSKGFLKLLCFFPGSLTAFLPVSCPLSYLGLHSLPYPLSHGEKLAFLHSTKISHIVVCGLLYHHWR